MATTTHENENTGGWEYRPNVIGKFLYRVSQRYVADHLGELVRTRRVGAAKLDIVLRGLALSPDHAGAREPGTVIRKAGRTDYAALHDLVHDRHRFSLAPEEAYESTREELDRKQEWVREQLRLLETRGLLERRKRRGGPRQIVMLSDLGDGRPYDDPGAEGRPYITLHGPLVSSAEFIDWGAPDIVGYVCALTAERFARPADRPDGKKKPHGSGRWYRQADWFNNGNGYRFEDDIVYPFSTSTIERGLKAMRDRGLVDGERRKTAPDGTRFDHPRMIYKNRFYRLGAGAEVIDLTTRIGYSKTS